MPALHAIDAADHDLSQGAAAAPATAPTFDDFWLLFPRHVAKKAARRAWERLSAASQVAALVGLVSWATVWRFEAQRREDWLEYLPHPASWLNGERWEDELPPRFRPTVGAPAPSAVSPGEPVARVEMPPQVRAALERLRTRVR